MKGKEKCEQLKAIRRSVAEKYQLEYTPHECRHEGECSGTCPACDKELEYLQQKLNEKGIDYLALEEEEEKEMIKAEEEEEKGFLMGEIAPIDQLNENDEL